MILQIILFVFLVLLLVLALIVIAPMAMESIKEAIDIIHDWRRDK